MIFDACLIFVAPLCINSSARVTPINTGGGVQVNIMTQRVNISVRMSSDNMTPADLSIMQRSCLGQSCFYHTMHCRWSRHSQCVMYYVEPNSVVLRRMHFSGTPSDIAAAFSRLRVAFGNDTAPISELLYDNGREDAPSCLPRSGCTS